MFNPLFKLVGAALLWFATFFTSAPLHAQRQSEKLGRAVLALRGVDSGGNGTNNWSGTGVNQVYVGWRLLATDPENIAFNVYRSANGASAVKLNSTPITASTNFVDSTANLAVANTYHVRPVLGGVESSASEPWTLPAGATAQPCFTIPMPALPGGGHYVHLAWPGDVDGDGYTDIVVDRIPSAGGTLRVEAYSTRTRSRLWTVDLGPNSTNLISAGQNDGVTVADFNGDGACEVVTKAVAGTVFGDGAVMATPAGAIFLCVLDGATGRELSRLQVAPSLGSSTDPRNIGIACLDGVRPSLVVMTEWRNFIAYDVSPQTFALTVRWSRDRSFAYAHGFRIGDIDGDGRDEISDIGGALDHDGTILFTNELNHGDRFHVADLDPARPGLEVFAVQQDNPTQLSQVLYDADTGEMLWRKYAPVMVDNGRGNIGSLDAGYTGQQVWSASSSQLADHFGNPISTTQPVCNFSIWWDADPLRELLNRQLVDKWNGGRLLTGYNFEGATYSWRDAVPLYGDILGDWREEIVTDNGDGTQLVIFSTTRVATSRYYTLLHDPQYRADLTLKGYMQSHHPGFYFGQNMPRPPRAPHWSGDLTWVGSAGANIWDTSSLRWKTSATGPASASYAEGRSVLFDLSGVSSTPVILSTSFAPSAVVVHAPAGQAYTFAGPGALTGPMTLTKGGQGSLTLAGDHSYTGNTVVSEGTLRVDGTLAGSSVRVDSRGVLAGSGTLAAPVQLAEIRSALAPGGIGAAGTLTFGSGLTQAAGAIHHYDLSGSPSGANDRISVTGNLTLAGPLTLRLTLLNDTLAAGANYTLITYSGTFTGNLSLATIEGADAFPCTLVNTGSAILLQVGAQRGSATVTWAGGQSGVWRLAAGAGWSGGTEANFVTGDTVRFTDTGASAPSVSIPLNVRPAATVVDASVDYTFAGLGAIGGAGGLTKRGSGTLTLNTTNTYTGPTRVEGGVLAVPSLADGGQPSPIGASSGAASNLVLDGGTLRLTGGSTSTFRGLTLGASGGTLDLPASSSLLNLSGPVTGSGPLAKTGPGRLLLSAVNTHTGGTTIRGGTVVLTASRESNSATSPIQYGLGSGPVTLAGGTLSLSDTSQGDLDFVASRAFWPIIVPAGSSGRLEANGRMTLGSSLAGSGDFTFYTPYVRTDITGDWSAFAGKLNVIADGDGGDFRIANAAGLPNAWLDLAANVWAYSRAGSGTPPLSLGALAGAAGSVLNAGTGSGLGANQPAHWRIGARNLDTTYAGSIRGTSLLTKVGTGTLTLAGANTYTGATTVSAGSLVLAGGGSLSGSAVSVAANAGFGGAGGVTGNVAFASGSRLLLGAAGPLAVTGNVSLSGTITVAPAPGEPVMTGAYTVITYTGTRSGTPAFAWSVPGYSAVFDTSANDRIVVTITPLMDPPTNLVVTPGDASATLAWTAPAGAATFSVRRGDAAGSGLVTVASGLTVTTYADTTVTNGVTYTYTVVAHAAAGFTTTSDPALVSVGPFHPRALWRLDETSGATAFDSTGRGWHGTLVANPARVAGRLDHALNLPATAGQHVSLPAGVLNGLRDFTFAAWVRVNSLSTWARILDCGTGTTNYLFLTPRHTSSSGTVRFAIRTTASGAEQVINGSSALPAATWVHVAVTLSGTTGTLYVNGVAVGSNPAMTLAPADLGSTTANYLGRSQFASDPFLNATLDDVRLYARALSAAELAAFLAPPSAPTNLSATPGPARLDLAWPSVPAADAYSVQRATTAAGPFLILAPRLPALAFTDTNVTPGVTYHYVVTALSGPAESARSNIAAAAPLPLLTALETWRQTHFGAPSPVGDAADTADPDGDGLVNLLEYALGGHPLTPNPGRLPTLALTLGLPPSLVLAFERIADPALVYQVQAADSLTGPWQPIWSSTGAENTPGTVQVPDSTPLAPPARRFLRLQVSTPAP